MLTPLAMLRHVLFALAAVACIAPAHAALLTVVKAGSGGGTVSSTPGGINCGATCSAEFSDGAAVFLTATASPGSTFSGWSGGACSGTSGCLVLLSSSPQTITATFALIPTLQSALDNPALTWTTSGNAPWAGQTQAFVQGGSAARSGTIGNGQVSSLSTTVTGPVTLAYSWKVSSEANSDFLNLFINGSPQVGISGEVDWIRRVAILPAGVYNLEWRYSKDSSGSGGQDAAWLDFITFAFPLTVSKSGTGSGQVTSSPAGINCGATCSVPWSNGTQVTLTAAASAGSIFTGWSGACSGTSPTCTVSMTAARSVTAGFAQNLGMALDNPALSWTSSGTAPWAPQSQVFFSGGSAARSGQIGPTGVSTLSTTVTGPGILGFWWKISSGPSVEGPDLLIFSINGTDQPGFISGEADWNYRVFNLPPGVHQLEWRYTVGLETNLPENAAWLDAVTFTRNPRDFSTDGLSDLLWQNTSTGDRFVWFMNGAAYSGAASLGVVSTDWSMAGSADFNGDGQSDILWQNTITGDRFIWFMNGASYLGGVSLGAVPTAWSIAGAADFNGDGKPDILWQNTATGERVLWFMNGATYTGAASLGTVPTDWSIAGTGDYNTDGRPDILWQNTATGERVLWFMNGATYTGAASLGIVPTEWSIVGTGDFNGDARPDIVWQNNANGDRYVWFMNGASFSGAAFLGSVPPVWSLVR